MLDNYIDGKEFMNLSEQDVKDIIPAIGIVKKIMRLSQKVLITCNPNSCAIMHKTHYIM